ncbi:tyrosine-type recombinase/integrase [Litchfieldella xinjiangensis]|uniref:tyrosine-type recombinase/integrase n=1 Tax=Litchfieldella xinjiangensis TaxID=1166948 RepID=UPI0005B8EABC|nr:site-specific integrase [Halomonas xinjiangensis]
MEQLNAARLIALWQADKNPVVQPSSLEDTQWILEAVFGDIPASEMSLDREAVSHLISGLFEWRQSIGRTVSYRQARKRVNRVLEHLNQIPGMQTVLMPEPILAHRPTALPPTGRALMVSEQMAKLDRRLLDWCRHTAIEDAWLLVLAVRLMTRLGMGETVALGTLAMLTRQHVNQRWLAIPSAPGERLPDGGHYRIWLPDDVWVPLRAILARETDQKPTHWLLAKELNDQTLDHAQRVRLLRNRLKTATKLCLKALESHPDSNGWSRLRSWSALVYASQYVPVLRGIPPLWARLLRQYSLPTCTPVPLLKNSGTAHLYAPGEQLGRLPNRTTSRSEAPNLPVLGEQTQPAGLSLLATDFLPNDWPRRVKNILQQFLAEVRHLGSDTVNGTRFVRPMQRILEQYEEQLVELIGHAGSYPQWLLHFLYHQLRIEGNKLSSARTKLSRLTPITLMMHEAVLDLSDWDDEVVLELQEVAESGSHWAPATRAAFFETFRQFLVFCQRFGQLDGVSLPRSGGSPLAPSVLRTRILSPDHMQTVWSALTNRVPNGDPRQMKGLVIALGFYGGLRASEVLSLTLNNVLLGNEDEPGRTTCWIEILGGKTSAARRRVALHVMAPPSVVKAMRGWVEERRKECAAWSLAAVALFGPRHAPEAYTRSSLITPVMEWMRYVLGEDIDFHGLRHAAASWTLLRLHAAQRPEFCVQLQHRHDWMFCDEALQATLAYFCGAEGSDTLARGTLLLQVAKWIGHRDPDTLLQHYAHVLGLLHSDVLAPQRA